MALNHFGDPRFYPFLQELELLESLGIRGEGFETGLQIGLRGIRLSKHLLERLERFLDFLRVHFLIGFLQRFQEMRGGGLAYLRCTRPSFLEELE